MENKLKYGKHYVDSNFVCTKENGDNIKDTQRRLGHSKIGTTMDTYSHVTEKLKQDNVDQFEHMIKVK